VVAEPDPIPAPATPENSAAPISGHARRTEAVRESMRGRVASHGDTPASSGNVANIITVVRILLAPVFVVLLLADNGEHGWLRWAAAALFIVAIATDGVDGSLARKRNLVTNVGIILDPIADKVLTGAALIVLSMLGELWWWVTIVILVRELGITAMRFSVLRSRVIPELAPVEHGHDIEARVREAREGREDPDVGDRHDRPEPVDPGVLAGDERGDPGERADGARNHEDGQERCHAGIVILSGADRGTVGRLGSWQQRGRAR
jgi:phosphatidylglycerophosphate synthase